MADQKFRWKFFENSRLFGYIFGLFWNDKIRCDLSENESCIFSGKFSISEYHWDLLTFTETIGEKLPSTWRKRSKGTMPPTKKVRIISMASICPHCAPIGAYIPFLSSIFSSLGARWGQIYSMGTSKFIGGRYEHFVFWFLASERILPESDR